MNRREKKRWKRGIVFFALTAALTLQMTACAEEHAKVPAAEFALGSDISWAADDDEAYTDRHGNVRKLYDICRNDYGMNTVRLRTWVNHPEGDCGEDSIIAYAKKCSEAGLRIMIDFHYSDNWADPDKQFAPAAWNVTNDTSPAEAVRVGQELYDYTYAFLLHMREEGVIPQWVQIGNEITNGMLWPLCDTSHPENLAYVLQQGIRAVRDASPETKIVLHVSGAAKTERVVAWFDALTERGVTDFDVIGLSFYPQESDPESDLKAVSDTFRQLYGKYCKGTSREIMMVEIGANYMTGATTAQKYEMICDVIQRLKNIPEGRGTGCLYWEIERYEMETSLWSDAKVPNQVWQAFSPNGADRGDSGISGSNLSGF